jgi:dTDP-4-dehydrorhamnose 3,5-epimerase
LLEVDLIVENTELGDVKLITPTRFEDPRGYFFESWNQDRFAQHGISLDFVQDNQSFSRQTGTLRGLHYQSPPKAQDKLVSVPVGAVWDVVVDVRKGSPDFGKWRGFTLSAQNGHQLLVPVGFLHGFVTTEPGTVVAYKCTEYYSPEHDGSIRFDDPDLAIDWGIPADQVIISSKDRSASLFSAFESPF